MWLVTPYGLLHAAAFAMGIAIAMRESRRRAVPDRTALPFFLIVAVTALGSGRVAESFLSATGVVPAQVAGWSGVGFPATIALCGIAATTLRWPTLDLLDCIAIATVPAEVVGKLGCWFGRCCGGVPIESPRLRELWSSVAPASSHLLHPTQLYHAALFASLTPVFLVGFRRAIRGVATGWFLISFGLSRVAISELRVGFPEGVGDLNVDQCVGVIVAVCGASMVVAVTWTSAMGKRSRCHDVDEAARRSPSSIPAEPRPTGGRE